MNWIMIIFISGYSNGGATTADFASLEACEKAKVAVEKTFDRDVGGTTSLCVHKYTGETK